MALKTTLNETEHRYEAHVDGELAGFAEYRSTASAIVFTHTEVDDRFEGQGVGSALARSPSTRCGRAAACRVVPRCPFIKAWIDKHPEYADPGVAVRPTPARRTRARSYAQSCAQATPCLCT